MIVPLPLKPITLEQRMQYLEKQTQLALSIYDWINKECLALQEELNCIAQEKSTIS